MFTGQNQLRSFLLTRSRFGEILLALGQQFTVKPLSHIHDCEHDWTRLLQSCSTVWRACSQSCSVVFRRVQPYEHRVAKIIVLNFWACSKNQHDFYRILWPINGRVRPYERRMSVVWRACLIVFNRMKGVWMRPYDWTRLSYGWTCLPNSVTWYTRARHFVIFT